MLHPPGHGSSSQTTPATAEAPHSGTALRGPTATGPVPRHSRGALCSPRLPGSEQTSNETEPTGTFSKPGAVRSKADTTQVGVRGKPDGPGGSAAPGPPRCVALPLGPGPAALRVQPRAGLCAQREKDFTPKEKQRSVSSWDTSKGTILRSQWGARGTFCFSCAATEAVFHLSPVLFCPRNLFFFFSLLLEEGESKFFQM